MQVRAATSFSLDPDSQDAGQLTGQALIDGLAGDAPKLVLVYVTTNHDQEQLLGSLRDKLGTDVQLLGCSVQGTVGDGELTEEGFAVAAMAFGGSDLKCAAAMERDIAIDTENKGQSLGSRLKEQLGGEPGVVIMLYDPLCGANVETLLAGLRRELSCEIVGGGAGQPWGPAVQTFQYCGQEVMSHGVVALGLKGPFAVEVGICHGTSPTGVSMTITKTDDTRILEIDGQPALDVWNQSTGFAEQGVAHQDYLASWALGLQRSTPDAATATEKISTVIRGAFGLDPAAGAVIVQAAIPNGSRVMFHHRTVENVLSGTEAMSNDLAGRLSGRTPWAVLGFECAARTFPFLGEANTIKEHRQLRAAVAPAAPWLGMMAWGEIGPSGGRTAFHNYTFPLVVFTEQAA